ncbi:MAG TPA: glycosyltransferase N-terminal domain-containing protein [Gemmatimonadales bacterium]|nr:glycosyltransferase N-terminal domain-containing protein [Gemmatimonadales bacterium]
MPSTPVAYRLGARLLSGLAPVLSPLSPKLAAGHRGRRGAGRRLAGWAERSRDRARRLVWFHASSVGEGLQAESVLQELRGLEPEAQFVYTHYSPSAEPLARRLPVDAADYLPYDLPAAADSLLEALRPSLLVFSKLDLWPELATRAASRGTRVAIVAGTVSPGSGRLRWPARSLLREGYRAVAAAAAVSEENAGRLARLGVAPDAIHVLGDPRFDSVMRRISEIGPDPLLRFGADAPTMVAGSTWPADEAMLLAALGRVRAHRPGARLILVPHEPTETHLAAVDQAARRAGLPAPVRLSAATGPVPLLLVDRVGVLATLYGAGTMAYVGGGFGRAGLHSVLEPAAWGVPVAFGPRWRESRDAALLLDADAAVGLERDGPPGVEEMDAVWRDWMEREERRSAQGARARRVVEGGLGAARRSAEMLSAAVTSSPHLRTSPIGGRPAPA